MPDLNSINNTIVRNELKKFKDSLIDLRIIIEGIEKINSDEESKTKK